MKYFKIKIVFNKNPVENTALYVRSRYLLYQHSYQQQIATSSTLISVVQITTSSILISAVDQVLHSFSYQQQIATSSTLISASTLYYMSGVGLQIATSLTFILAFSSRQRLHQHIICQEQIYTSSTFISAVVRLKS